ncbi:hypothetical protein RB653_005699 [Dictyostelium firmibasis]|uniref:Uncharacterized protein n=1 Tax=Dictyostelium firmibasis TaxID=79012 RepID=A0AAN7Z1D3_9MYCE
MESQFNLTFPPVLYAIVNKDNKTLSCGGIITVSGKNLLTNDEEFKVKVLANNKITNVIVSDEKTLIVRAEKIEYINASITLSSSNLHLTCNLQCSVLQNETFYYYISNTSKSSSNENNNSNNTDCLSCCSKSNPKEITGVLNLQLGSSLFQHDVNIEEIESSLPSNDDDGDKSSKLPGGAIAGITIGSVAAGAIVGFVFYFKIITRAKNSFK